MTTARDTYVELFKLASQSCEVRDAVKLAAPWWVTAPAAAGVGLGSYYYGKGVGADEKRKQMEADRIHPALLFGSGALAGYLGPKLLSNLGNVSAPNTGEFTSI